MKTALQKAFCQNATARQINELDLALQKLALAVRRGRSDPYCLSLWSRFVRLRDGNRCVVCGSKRGLAAHHIVRKCMFRTAYLQTGNGITLCSKCHHLPHEVFNRRPNLQLPMDAEGGEQIDRLTALYWHLAAHARQRGLLRDDFYFLSDDLLQSFKSFQGFDPVTSFPGFRVDQAYLIWRQTPRHLLKALAEANGLSIPASFVQIGEVAVFLESDVGCASEHHVSPRGS
jgi:hypothetical protein